MLQKLNLTWSFDSCLDNRDQLQIELKPIVAKWVQEMYPKLVISLKGDSLTNNSTSVEIFSAPVKNRSEPVWLFAAMSVNRTMPSDCVVTVGSTKDFVEVVANAFVESQQERNRPYVQKVSAGYKDKTLFVLKNISEEEFHSLYLGPRIPHLREVEWFSDLLGRVLGAVVLDLVDNDWSYVVLGRDERGLFRCIDMRVSIEAREKAAEKLREKMETHLSTGAKVFPQGD